MLHTALDSVWPKMEARWVTYASTWTWFCVPWKLCISSTFSAGPPARPNNSPRPSQCEKGEYLPTCLGSTLLWEEMESVEAK